MSIIIKDTLHPENESGTDIYPKTSTDQVVGYGQDANGKDFALKEDVLKKPSGQSNKALFVVGTNATGDESVRVPVGNGNDEMPRRNNRGMVENSDLATYPNELIPKRQLDSAIKNVSLPVINITATSTATEGTISSSDLQVLQGNKSTIVRFNNELYYFMDDEYKSGYLTYSHVGVDAGIQWVKSITITISSLSWVLTKSQVNKRSTDLYRHVVYFYKDTSYYQMIFHTNNNERIIPQAEGTTWYNFISPNFITFISPILYIQGTSEYTPFSIKGNEVIDLSGEVYNLVLYEYQNEIITPI